jgi:hypothetical protein
MLLKCTNCGEEKDSSCFKKQKRNISGFSGVCKSCLQKRTDELKIMVFCCICLKPVMIEKHRLKKQKGFVCRDVNSKRSKCWVELKRIQSMESIKQVDIPCHVCGKNVRINKAKFEDDGPGHTYFCKAQNGDTHSNCYLDYARRNRVLLNCEWCGADVEKSKWQAAQSKHSFCKAQTGKQHSECYNNWRDENKKQTWILVNCAWCEAEFKILRNRNSKGQLHFCKTGEKGSGKKSDCYSQYKLSERAAVVCASCGKTLYLQQHYAELVNNTFCPECLHEGNYSGEFTANWRGGIANFPYPPEFNDSLKQEIKERDGFTCHGIECEGNYNLLSIHHVGYDKNDCLPENLITLCSSCHGKTNFNRKINEWIYKKILFERYGYKYNINFYPVYLIAPEGLYGSGRILFSG